MKIIISFLMAFSVYVYAASGISTNMDKKVYYDADRTVQDENKILSEELELFINNQASDELIQEYKDGQLKDSELQKIEQEKAVAANPNQTTPQAQQTQEPSFFAKMLEKIGIGSTKKLPADETVTPTDTKVEDKAATQTAPVDDTTTADTTASQDTPTDTVVEPNSVEEPVVEEPTDVAEPVVEEPQDTTTVDETTPTEEQTLENEEQ